MNQFKRVGANHITLFQNLIKLFKQSKITPIFFFDGEATSDKNVAYIARRKQIESTSRKIEHLEGELRKLSELKLKKSPLLERKRKKRRKRTKINMLDILFDEEHTQKISDLTVPVEELDLVHELDFYGLCDRIQSLQTQLKRKITQNTPPSSEDYESLKLLLVDMNCEYRVSETEADHEIARSYRNGDIYGVFSEDMDMLTFGIGILVRGLTTRPSDILVEYSLDRILEGLNLDMVQFVDLCIMFGTDYAQTIRGIGPANAYRIIKTGEYGYQPNEQEIEPFLVQLSNQRTKTQNKQKYQVPENWMNQRNRAREIFIDLNV
jgi:5'-3' exonuclease